MLGKREVGEERGTCLTKVDWGIRFIIKRKKGLVGLLNVGCLLGW